MLLNLRLHRASVLLLGAALLAVPSPASASAAGEAGAHTAAGAVHEGQARVNATLVAARDHDVLRVAVHFEMDEGWHIYWKNPGQTGLATEVLFDVDAGRTGALEWPAPSVFSQAGGFIVSYGYEGAVSLGAPVALEKPGQRTVVTADVDYLACASVCVPGTHTLVLTVDPGEADDPRAHRSDNVPREADQLSLAIDTNVAPSPVPAGAAFAVEIVVRDSGEEDRSLGVITDEASFVPERVPQLAFEPDSAVADPDGTNARIALQGFAGLDPVASDQVVPGVLRVLLDGEIVPIAVEFVVPRAASNSPTPETP